TELARHGRDAERTPCPLLRVVLWRVRARRSSGRGRGRQGFGRDEQPDQERYAREGGRGAVHRVDQAVADPPAVGGGRRLRQDGEGRSHEHYRLGHPQALRDQLRAGDPDRGVAGASRQTTTSARSVVQTNGRNGSCVPPVTSPLVTSWAASHWMTIQPAASLSPCGTSPIRLGHRPSGRRTTPERTAPRTTAPPKTRTASVVLARMPQSRAVVARPAPTARSQSRPAPGGPVRLMLRTGSWMPSSFACTSRREASLS